MEPKGDARGQPQFHHQLTKFQPAASAGVVNVIRTSQRKFGSLGVLHEEVGDEADGGSGGGGRGGRTSGGRVILGGAGTSSEVSLPSGTSSSSPVTGSANAGAGPAHEMVSPWGASLAAAALGLTPTGSYDEASRQSPVFISPSHSGPGGPTLRLSGLGATGLSSELVSPWGGSFAATALGLPTPRASGETGQLPLPPMPIGVYGQAHAHHRTTSSPASVSNLSSAREGVTPNSGVPMVSELLLPYHPAYSTSAGGSFATPGSGGQSPFASMFHSNMETSASIGTIGPLGSARSDRDPRESPVGSNRATPITTPRDRSAAASSAGAASRRNTRNESANGAWPGGGHAPWAGQQGHLVAAAAQKMQQDAAIDAASPELTPLDSRSAETEVILGAFKKLALATGQPLSGTESPKTPGEGGGLAANTYSAESPGRWNTSTTPDGDGAPSPGKVFASTGGFDGDSSAGKQQGRMMSGRVATMQPHPEVQFELDWAR